MDSTDQFEIDAPRVICQALDGDVLLVSFESGLYYSARGVGADVCQLLTLGYSLKEVATTLAKHFEKPFTDILSDMEAFAAQLVKERLFVARVKTLVSKEPFLPRATTYQPPALEVFDDMADQLLLDKIEDDTREAWVKP